MRRFYAILAVLVLVVAAPAFAYNASPPTGRTTGARRTTLALCRARPRSPTLRTVSKLDVAWSLPRAGHDSYVFNPLVVDNVAYVLAAQQLARRLDATTGKELWIHEHLRGIAPRGINYWESKDRRTAGCCSR